MELEPIGRRLANLREAKALSKYRLAKMSGISRECLGSIESGRRDPSFEVLVRLSSVLGFSLGDLDGSSATSQKKLRNVEQ